MSTTYYPTADPRVLATVDLLTDALIAANRAGRTAERYTRRDRCVTAREVERADRAAHVAQVAAQDAIYDLASSLAADGSAVAS